MPESVMELFEQTGAFLRGHFRLTSGLHSAEYLQCAKVLAYPAYAREFAEQLANRLRAILPRAAALVVSPAIGGIVIGHEIARALGARAFFTERDSASNAMLLRRGFEIQRDEAVVVVEDVITTGGSTRDVIRVLQDAGADVMAAASIIDRSGGQADVGLPRVALQTLHPVTYDPADCPLCRAGTPAIKPGSRSEPRP